LATHKAENAVTQFGDPFNHCTKKSGFGDPEVG